MFKGNEKVLEVLVEKDGITTKELNELGYSASKINKLIDLGLIVREKRGYYGIASLEALKEFKLYLENKKNNEVTLGSNYNEVAEEFLKALQESDENILKTFRKLQEVAVTDNERRDTNYYLILLNQIYELDEEIIEKIKVFKYSDYIVAPGDERFTSRTFENKIRSKMFANLTNGIIEKFKSCKNFGGISYEIENILLEKACLTRENVRDYEERLLDAEKFSELYEFLLARRKRRVMSYSENSLLQTVTRYIEISENKVDITARECSSDNYLYQFYNNNFQKAYDLFMNVFNKSKNTKQDCLVEKILRKTLELVNESNYLEEADTEDVDNFGYIEKVEDNDDFFEENEDSSEEEFADTYNDDTLEEYTDTYAEFESLEDYTKNYYDELDEKLVEEKVDELYEGKSIIVLDPMDEEQRKHIHEIVSNFYDVVSFSIGKGCERRVVLRFRPARYAKENGRVKQAGRAEYVNYKEVIANARELQALGDYSGALTEWRKIIESGNPAESAYAAMGKCLLKTGKKYEALDYFRVVTELSREHYGKYDFTALINRLTEGDLEDEDKKPRYFEMKEDDFKEKTSFDYNFEKMDTLVALILEDGVSLDEAITRLELSAEEAGIARLIYARDCYYLEKYAEGDKYLRKVETTKKKSAYLKKLYNEVKTNRIFYKNRLDDEKKCLVLKKEN